MDTELEASVLRSPTSYVFIFFSKCKPNQLFLFLGLGCRRSHSRDPLANRSEGGSESCPLAALPLGGALFEWNLVLWKEVEENSIQAVVRK